MDTLVIRKNLLRHYIAIPQDHGAWVFLLSPLLIGLSAGGAWNMASLYLVIAALSAFLIRQPVTITVKILTGRRQRHDLLAAVFWISVYGLIGSLGAGGLVILGYSYLLLLAIPGFLVFSWHLFLVRRRAERRQLGMEIVASGVLALAAPAALWVGAGRPVAAGWLLWALTWFQSAASLVYVTMRLEQREQKTVLPLSERLREKGSLTRRAWFYSGFNTIAVIVLSVVGLTPAWLGFPYAVQLAETLWGSLHPATGARPAAVGIRQLIVSALFTVLFLLTWNFAR
jgi:hypothetical protein